ncbi:flavohemoglobin expression-modulating QEGLA motif protein [Frateuria aurantia]
MAESAVGRSADYAQLDRRLLELVRPIQILPGVAWSASQERALLESYRRGRVSLPEIHYAIPDFQHQRRALIQLQRELPAVGEHALGDYLRATAHSWERAAAMLEQVGTPGLATLSAELYGAPHDPIPGSESSNLDAARYFVELADELGVELWDSDALHTQPSHRVQHDLQREVDAWFGPGMISVVIDPELTAKAASGAHRIRLRGNAQFSMYDSHQLLHHEAFVHSLTALNGARQPVLASLARTSPRATLTQEGLAVFAELVSGSLDVARLKRISLRILAIDMAGRGADFVEVYRFFLRFGQSVDDSFHSARRVFRGVPATGGGAFAKDSVYLAGLFAVHTFFRRSLKHRQLELLRCLFAGKLALQDMSGLAAYFDSGTLLRPRWLPPWMAHIHGLAAKLAFSIFINGIRLHRLDP